MQTKTSKSALFPYVLWIAFFVIAPIALVVYYSCLIYMATLRSITIKRSFLLFT